MPKRKQVTPELRKLHNEEFHDLYNSPITKLSDVRKDDNTLL